MLEVSVSTDGVFVFFFNVAPAVVTTVCELSAAISVSALRQHSEMLRQQLAMLGVLKLPPVPWPLPTQPAGTVAVAFAASPRRPSAGASSTSILSGFHGGKGTVTAGALGGDAVVVSAADADDDADTQWLKQAVGRLCWEQRVLDRLFVGSVASQSQSQASLRRQQ